MIKHSNKILILFIKQHYIFLIYNICSKIKLQFNISNKSKQLQLFLKQTKHQKSDVDVLQ